MNDKFHGPVLKVSLLSKEESVRCMNACWFNNISLYLLHDLGFYRKSNGAIYRSFGFY